MDTNQKENRYFRAKEQVRNIKKFYTGLFMYVIFISALAGLNYYVDGLRNPWFLWAALGWGIGLIFQAAKAFVWNPKFGKDWEERKIKQIMDEEERTGNKRWN